MKLPSGHRPQHRRNGNYPKIGGPTPTLLRHHQHLRTIRTSPVNIELPQLGLEERSVVAKIAFSSIPTFTFKPPTYVQRRATNMLLERLEVVETSDLPPTQHPTAMLGQQPTMPIPTAIRATTSIAPPADRHTPAPTYGVQNVASRPIPVEPVISRHLPSPQRCRNSRRNRRPRRRVRAKARHRRLRRTHQHTRTPGMVRPPAVALMVVPTEGPMVALMVVLTEGPMVALMVAPVAPTEGLMVVLVAPTEAVTEAILGALALVLVLVAFAIRLPSTGVGIA